MYINACPLTSVEALEINQSMRLLPTGRHKQTDGEPAATHKITAPPQKEMQYNGQ